MSLKHGGNTRPWVSLFRRAESVECSYEALVTVLEGKERLDLIASVNRSLNRDMIEITRSVKEIFESLEKVEEPTLQLVAPSYYLLMKKFTPTVRESRVMNIFNKNLQKIHGRWCTIIGICVNRRCQREEQALRKRRARTI
jgi:hypothetical protein